MKPRREPVVDAEQARQMRATGMTFRAIGKHFGVTPTAIRNRLLVPDPDVTGTCGCGCGGSTEQATVTRTELGWVRGEPKPYLPHHSERVAALAGRFDECWVENGGCWLWQHHLNNRGYGTLSVNGQVGYAHRFSYERRYGPIPIGLEVDHLCRNRACVNPAHLEAVTGAENSRRGKHTKLTQQKVDEMRALARAGWMLKDIASVYGVHRAHVSRVCSGQSWA